MTPAAASAVPEGAHVTIRCAGHLNRAGMRVQARIATAVHVGAAWGEGVPRWQLEDQDGTSSTMRFGNDRIAYIRARADSMGSDDDPAHAAVQRRLTEHQSAASAGEAFDYRYSFRCRGCRADVQVSEYDVLCAALDAAALAGRSSVTLPDLGTLVAIVKRRIRRN